MKKLLGGSLLLLAVPFFLAARPAEPLAHFQITLERTANGWEAKCDSGCSWTALSMTCPDDCRVLIDARGVTAGDKGIRTDAAFGFVLSRGAKSWQAESLAGTAWSKIGWGCLVGLCRARIDETGVKSLSIGG